MKNVLVAQSGGPSPVINASLQGVIDACRDHDSFGAVYAAFHGVEGILKEEIIDLGTEEAEELARLRQTPGAGAIGTCRYKLHDGNDEDFGRIVDVFAAHNVGYFFYIGGNDSMDTARKVADLARERGVELTVVGVPKTIDNDVGDSTFDLVDHTPGYGSAARYWASVMQILEEENRGMCSSEPIAVIQAMGRSSGFIPAAARLADPKREMPLQLYLAESDHTLASMTDCVSDELRRSGRCIVVVSEGFPVGSIGERHDAFGHVEYAASESTVAQVVVNHLNRAGLPVPGYATGQVPGALQRSTSIFASAQDRTEAYEVGRHAVALAAGGTAGVMATIRRAGGVPRALPPGEGAPEADGPAPAGSAPSDGQAARAGGPFRAAPASPAYRPVYAHVPLAAVANFHRQLPAHWLSADQLDVTDDFVRYAQPLIGDTWPEIGIEGGVQRFARLRRNLLPQKLRPYVPQNNR